MAKVICARTECKYNKDGICKAKEVKLRAWHINTVHEGFKRMEECLTYEESEEYKITQSIVNQFLTIKNEQKGK